MRLWTYSTFSSRPSDRSVTFLIISGIAGFNSESLKPTETVEKVVLPGSDEIKTERTIQGVLNGVKGFDGESLKTVKTREPASPMEVVQVGFLEILFFYLTKLFLCLFVYD